MDDLQTFRQRHLHGQTSGDDTPINNDDAVSQTSSTITKRRQTDSRYDAEKNSHATGQNDPSLNQQGSNEPRLNQTVSAVSQFESKDPYTYVGYKGWRRYRVLNPLRGMYHDVKRRLPYYPSDFTDAFTYRTLAGTIRIYFVNLLPAIAYILDMYRRTGQFYGVNEALLSSAIAATVFSILGAQPITIVGVTGLISLFNYTIYDIIKQHDISIYPQFMAWTGIWTAILHWAFAIFNVCDYMRYVTDFSSETFGMYVGIIYMVKGVEELVDEFTRGDTNGFMSCMVAILYFASVYGLERLGVSTWFKPGIRGFIADYAYPIVTIFWVGFCHVPGSLKGTHISTVPITKAFRPTQDRNWVIDFWNLEAKWVFAALPFGFLVTLLFYYDHNVSSLTAQAKQYPLKKPGGFHWDFFLLGCTSFACGIIGVPMPNGLVPQAPIHTDSLCVYQTDLQVIRTEDVEGEEIRRPQVKILNVVEQRVTHLAMALLFYGTMTRPLLVVLGTMPRAIFAGVFLTVGWGSIEGNGITHKLLFLIKERRFLPPDDPLHRVPIRKIVLYISIQAIGVAVCVAISQTIAAIGFPVLICALIPLRWVYFPKWFTVQELDAMDALTADNPVVLASFGGRPEGSGGMSSSSNNNNNNNNNADGVGGKNRGPREYVAKKEGVQRQRAGSFHR